MTIDSDSAYTAVMYGQQFAPFYDDLFPRTAVGDAETMWLRSLLPRTTKTIVELGVGTGRVALPLLESLDVPKPVFVGVDLSSEMLDRLVDIDSEGGVVASLGDASTFDYPGPVDAILCVCGTISMIHDQTAQANAISRAAEALNPGGVLIVETHDAELIRSMHVQEKITYAVPYPGPNRALVTFSTLTGTDWQLDHAWIDNGTASFCRERSRLTTLEELDDYAAAGGLEVLSHTRGLDGAPLEHPGPTVTAVYRKPRG